MDNLFNRKYTVQGLFLIVCLILVGKLFYMQIVSDKYFLLSNSNVLRKIYTFPARGVIFDRKGRVLVQNEPVYDLMVIPNQVKEFDTLDLCNTIGIDTAGFRKRFHKAVVQSRYQPSTFEKQLSVQTYAALQEKLSNFPGFLVQGRTVRHYPDSVAGQFFGYVKEVSPKDIEDSEGYYRPGDYIGKSGVEKQYNDILRGERGVKNMLYDARNVPQGSYQEGKFDTLARSGEKVVSSLDMEIQKLGEQLMQNKVGSIVAIEPATGEVLAFVSSPGYDPNRMVGRQQGNNYMDIFGQANRPFLVRPISGYYSPGSSFKPLDALIGLQEGVITPDMTFNCPGGYWAGNHFVRCEHVDGTISLRRGLARSCNTYACYVFQKLMTQTRFKNQKLAYDEWESKVRKFGIGQKLDIDMPYERKGILFTSDEYTKRFGKYWRYTTVISLAIGQGEMSATPLQMANIMAIIANKGYYIKPHLIKSIGDKKIIKKDYVQKNYVDIDAAHFEPVIDGMQDAVNSPWGTANASRIPNVLMCGKTGTVQNPHGKNHSVFIGFAPRDNPKIAIAVVVENAGYGGAYAAPIASYLTEKYLTGNISGGRMAQVEWMKKQSVLPEVPKPKIKLAPKTTDSVAKEAAPTAADPKKNTAANHLKSGETTK
ncbi:penicillin-binding protein 2 [Pedobacter nutrimenti]|jgi:penicillin-binding protein 2|uniref:Penicillin-binding protein 2 n=1 Tax=Pedobacter nutrimenti TaxID=1241337 RepID=A0A318UD83_9SPHI|nr:penicillin-binding protein 2 [Pedobacter nutrimenti]PYF72456.1 penicillin-binding protein 2 [Pedobacter nutrimenti]